MARPTESGQMFLPILTVLFLFGLFWVAYVLWCRSVYWKMRMDVAADMVALSAAREQAALLNYTATFQMAENAFLPEAIGYGVMQVRVKSEFEALNKVVQGFQGSFKSQVFSVAQMIAKANGANRPAFPALDKDFSPADDFNSRLKAHAVHVLYFSGIWPVGGRTYKTAYYTRTWSPDKTKAQPPHESRWTTCRGSICESGRARLWLDVDIDSWANNGGFPSEKASLLRSVGIQCFYPQFNARLILKK